MTPRRKSPKRIHTGTRDSQSVGATPGGEPPQRVGTQRLTPGCSAARLVRGQLDLFSIELANKLRCVSATVAQLYRPAEGTSLRLPYSYAQVAQLDEELARSRSFRAVHNRYVTQRELFAAGAAASIPGLCYVPEFVSEPEAAQLLALIGELPFHEAQYKEWHARRRIVSFGGRYDFTRNLLSEAPPDPRVPAAAARADRGLRERRTRQHPARDACRVSAVDPTWLAPGRP